MGRSASHITLECALATHPNCALIGEEIFSAKKTLQQITAELADLICQRSEQGKDFGVILIPEGLIEFIPEVGLLIQELNIVLAKEAAIDCVSVQKLLTPASQSCFSSLPRIDPKAVVAQSRPSWQCSGLPHRNRKAFDRDCFFRVKRRRQEGRYQGKFNPVQHFLGYEGRSAFPSNFDCHYCYALGMTAALLIDSGTTGYMCYVKDLAQLVANGRSAGFR